jgi:hypothetical protein
MLLFYHLPIIILLLLVVPSTLTSDVGTEPPDTAIPTPQDSPHSHRRALSLPPSLLPNHTAVLKPALSRSADGRDVREIGEERKRSKRFCWRGVLKRKDGPVDNYY